MADLILSESGMMESTGVKLVDLTCLLANQKALHGALQHIKGFWP